MKNRLISRDWEKWDFSHCVIRPTHETAMELEKIVREEMKRFYSPLKSTKAACIAMKSLMAGRTSEAGKELRLSMINMWGRYAVSKLYC